MSIIGLTGGIASGKSTVSREFQAIGIPGVDADKVAHSLDSSISTQHIYTVKSLQEKLKQ